LKKSTNAAQSKEDRRTQTENEIEQSEGREKGDTGGGTKLAHHAAKRKGRNRENGRGGTKGPRRRGGTDIPGKESSRSRPK